MGTSTLDIATTSLASYNYKASTMFAPFGGYSGTVIFDSGGAEIGPIGKSNISFGMYFSSIGISILFYSLSSFLSIIFVSITNLESEVINGELVSFFRYCLRD